MVCAFSREAKTDVPSLTDSEEETIVLAAELNAPLVAETRSGQSYLNKYDELVANPPVPTLDPTKPSAKQFAEKQMSFDTPGPSQRTKQKELQHLTALMS